MANAALQVTTKCQQCEKSDCGTTQNLETIFNKKEKHDSDPPHLSFWLMGKVVVCEATQKTIAVTVRVFVKERFRKLVGVSSLQFKPAFTHAQTGHWNFKRLFLLQFLSRKVGGLGKTINQFCLFRATHKAPVSRKLGFLLAFPGPLGPLSS